MVMPVNEFVTRFYNECLNREPDQTGLDGWANALENGWITGADLAEGFILSPEFINRGTSDEEFLKILYQTFFNRQPDTVGFNGWLSALRSGTSRSAVLEGFIYSDEFSKLCNQYGIIPYSLDLVEAFVTRFYNECLNREPDQAGLDGWVNGLKNGWVTGGEVAESFIMSPEYTNLGTSDEEFLETLYRAFFNRQPDSVGFNGWLSGLRNGLSRLSVLSGFINSDEFFRLCADYGIDAVNDNKAGDNDDDGHTEISCSDISGNWSEHISGEITVTARGMTLSESIYAVRVVDATQSDCNVSIAYDDSGFYYTRYGTIDGNSLQISGTGFGDALNSDLVDKFFGGELPGATITFTKDEFTGHGTISSNSITINGTGVLNGRVTYNGETIDVKVNYTENSTLNRTAYGFAVASESQRLTDERILQQSLVERVAKIVANWFQGES